jgi:Flp pilus assembly protein TadG
MAARLHFPHLLRSREQRGASAVEFALVVTPLLILFFGMVQYGMYFYSAQVGSNTANATARQLSVGNCQNATSLATFVDGQLGAAKTAPASITTTYKNSDGTAATASTVKTGGTVTLSISFDTLNMNFPFVPFLSDPQIDRTVQARVEDNIDQGCGG